MTRFARTAREVKRRWRYKRDRGGDTWTWGRRIKRLVRGVLRYFYVGDCEDYCFRLVWRMEGSKAAAIKALKDGRYVIWWAAAKGDEIDHAVVQCIKTGEYAEVIFGKAVKRPNAELGAIRLKRIMPGTEALIRLGEVQSPYFSSDR